METNTKKKIGLLGCIGTGIGAIIGSGIFGSLPTVINDIGTGIVLALLATIVYTLAKTIPNVYLSSVAPASGSFFIAPTKLIHPAVGVFMAAQNLLQPVLISVFAVLFGDYFVALFPALEGYKTLISIVILLIYTGIAWQGNHTFAFVNNIMVVVLMVAMGCYIFVGMPSIDTSRLTLGEIFNPGVKLTSFAAAVGVLASSLSGGSAVSQIADDVYRYGYCYHRLHAGRRTDHTFRGGKNIPSFRPSDIFHRRRSAVWCPDFDGSGYYVNLCPDSGGGR